MSRLLIYLEIIFYLINDLVLLMLFLRVSDFLQIILHHFLLEMVINIVSSMCLYPKTIRNPKYCQTSYVSEKGRGFALPSHLSSSSEYITVNCGKCAECRDTYYNSILQRALCEARSSYMYFVTLTYDNEHVPNLILPSGERVMYSDYSDVQLLFKRLRNHNVLDRDFRYLCALEYGDTYSRPHVHLLIFVAKLPTDTCTTPYNIEDILFKNIAKFWSINVGTDKQPIYKSLFTYKVRYTSAGLKSNYFVKYVEPTVDYSTNVDDSDTFVRTIRYLISYVHKGSSFDNTILSILDNYHDVTLVKKLKNLLCSKVRFSKGFGCGFVNGKKFYLPRISVRCSSNTLVYSDLMLSLPATYEEFEDLYPTEAQDLIRFINKCKYRFYNTLDDALKHFTTYEYMMHCMYLRYFPQRFNYIYDTYYRSRQLDSISYYFHTADAFYAKPKVVTSDAIYDSDIYRYLRSGVDEALVQGVPFFAFKTPQGFTALCRYYKERICTIDDFQTLFNRLNISNYEEYKELFQHQIETKKACKVYANNFTRENCDKIICKSQKMFLDLPRNLRGINIFTTLLTNYKH